MPKFYQALIIVMIVLGYFWIADRSNENRAATEAQLFRNDFDLMSAYEVQGFSLGLFMGESEPGKLKKSPNYSSLSKAVSDDIDRSKKSVEKIAKGYRHTPRFFDARWLDSRASGFGLSAVVLRPDRRHRDVEICGELRFVYRLFYRAGPQESNLPFTLVAEYFIRPKDGCSASLVKIKKNLSKPEDLMKQLKNMRSNMLADRIEYNFQVNRFPHDGSDGFSDQAHYALGALNAENGTLKRSRLENSIDLAELKQNPKMAEELWEFLGSEPALQKLATATLFVPERFLADHATSVTPYGMLRKANRGFLTAFGEPEFEFNKKVETYFASKAEFLRALDESSCTGCHVSRSMAGFHVLGEIANRGKTFDRIKSVLSPYFMRIQSWRNQVFELGGLIRKPSVSEALGGELGGFCHINSDFKYGVSCKKGLICDHSHVDGSILETGQCINEKADEIGQMCESAFLDTNEQPLLDVWDSDAEILCPGQYICSHSIHGFAGGFCAIGCLQGDRVEGAHCTNVPILGPFTTCLEQGKLFKECLEKHSSKTQMPACTTNADCRQDYLCAGIEKGRGICAPPYFLHQMTIENHKL